MFNSKVFETNGNAVIGQYYPDIFDWLRDTQTKTLVLKEKRHTQVKTLNIEMTGLLLTPYWVYHPRVVILHL